MNEPLLRVILSLARRQQPSALVESLTYLRRGLATSSCTASTSGSCLPCAPRGGGIFNHATGETISMRQNSWHSAQSWRYAQASAARSEDYYTLLGLARDASDQDIKRAYYKLAKQYHPDTNQGNSEAAAKFQELQKAYETLRDPEKRRIYDQVGPEGMDRMEQEGGFPGAGGGFGNQREAEEMLHNIMQGNPFFEQFFRGNMVYQVPINLHLSFMEAVKGTRRAINVAVPGFSASGLEVDIPAGVFTGSQIPVDVPREKGKRQQVQVVLVLSVDPHPIFERDGANIIMAHSIPFSRALLGCKRQVDTVDGPVELQVPPGSQNGDHLVLKGKGTQMLGRRGRGDQIVILRTQVPQQLSERQKELLRDFEEEERKKGKKLY